MIIREADLFEFTALWDGDAAAGVQFFEYLKNGAAELWVAETDGNITGDLYLFFKLSDGDFADGKNKAHITNFSVKPELRGQGIGTKLLQRVFERLRQGGFTDVTIGVSESEAENIRLYQRLGFTAEVKRYSQDPICVNSDKSPVATAEFLLLSKYLNWQ